MPRRKIKKKPLRLFPRLAKRLFKGKDAFPAGRLERNNLGSGYFGNFYAPRRMPPGKQLVFHLMPIKADESIISKHRKYSWAFPKSIGHTAIFLHPKKNAAIVICIQNTTRLEKLPSNLRSRYRNWHIATLISAITYCRNRGIKLYAVLPQNYEDIHNYSAQLSLFPKKKKGTIATLYETTLKNAAKALGIKMRNVKTENVFGDLYSSYFGIELLKLV